MGGAGWQSPEAVRGTLHFTGLDRRGPGADHGAGLPFAVPCVACPLETTGMRVHVLWFVSGPVRLQVGAVRQETTPFRLTIVSSGSHHHRASIPASAHSSPPRPQPLRWGHALQTHILTYFSSCCFASEVGTVSCEFLCQCPASTH